MLAEPMNQSPSKPGRITRRTSLRQSLNLASMSKALADVIGKDKATKDSKSKKDKESRRPSAVNLSKPSASRPSMGDTRSPSQNTTRTSTPESRNSTRRRVSGSIPHASLGEQPHKQGEPTHNASQGVLTRAAALRAKSTNTATTSLPKYRPKTSPVERSKPSSGSVRVGTRRRLSNSDDEPAAESAIVSSEKGTRAISPLPQRAALQNLNTTNPTPSPPTPTKIQKTTPPSSRPSPTRPTKTFKTSNSASSAASRPSSSASSTSVSPTNLKTPVVKPALRRTTKDKNRSRNATPTASTPQPVSPSPITRHARSSSKPDGHYIGNMSHISELADEDEEEEEDVELLLAPVAVLGAPTPAMPRIRKQRPAKDTVPMTPIRDQLPSRANMSYLSPVPPGEAGGSSLRPDSLSNNSRAAGRGSILSWERLASEASKTLGEDELDKMLADIPAPFRSEVTSPALSANLEIPESPCLNAIDSLSGYGSISQVLLPDVTPSPALPPPHRFSLSPKERDTIDSSTVTMLKLQLAKAETIAKERLQQMQAMEEEIYSLREIQSRQCQELANHVANLKTFERAGEERMAYAASLEDQLRRTEVYRQQAIEDAIKRSEYNARVTLEIELKKERLVSETSCAARMASSGWSNVKELSEVELDLVRGDRAVLSVLLAELDQLSREFSL